MNEYLMIEKILRNLESNSRIDLHDLSVMLGVEEAMVANEVAQMEKEQIICGYTTTSAKCFP
jgi:DNA-binding Lrp family transcriptional regulator